MMAQFRFGSGVFASVLAGSASLFLASCSSDSSQLPADDAPLGQSRSALTTNFATGSLIIPMDTDSQNQGMIRAYGLVYRLLRGNVPVHWVIAANKAANGNDLTIAAPNTIRNHETNANVPRPRDYGGGPFVIDAANRTEALAIIDDWQQNDPAGKHAVVHEVTGAFTANVAKTLTAAPNIGVFEDGYQKVAYDNLNGAGITDPDGQAWSLASSTSFTTAQMAGPTNTNHKDGQLFENGLPRVCFLTSEHYQDGVAAVNQSGDGTTIAVNGEVISEVRSWLDAGPWLHSFMECEAIDSFENQTAAPNRLAGHFLTTGGLTVTGTAAINNIVNRRPDDPVTQIFGDFNADTGTGARMALPGGSNFVPGIRRLIGAGNNQDTNLLLVAGHLDGSDLNGRVTYLGGHNYSTTTPITSNPLTNTFRAFYNAMLDSPCLLPPNQPNVTVTISGPNPATVKPGPITYTITYNNTGGGPALGVVVTEPIPGGTIFTSATNGGAVNGGNVVWNLPPIAPGGSGSVSYTVNAPADGSVNNNGGTFDYRAWATPRETAIPGLVVTVDGTPPDTTIESGPPLTTTDTKATFDFSSNETPVTYQCKVDAAAFAACTDPVTFNGPFGAGAHTILVRAVDKVGNVDPTPATYTWTVIANNLDDDGDGLTNAQEQVLGTNPNDADSDDDGVNDGDEVNVFKTNPLSADTDGDGLFDGTELGKDCSLQATNTAAGKCIPDADPATKTDPLKKDTDNGSVPDGTEDKNHNGKVDAGETDPNNGADDVPSPDDDGDGLTNAQEQVLGTNPNDADSDDDGVNDGDEVNVFKTNPLSADTDGDGLFDGTELGKDCSLQATNTAAGKCIPDADPSTKTDPLKKDTDNGSVPDGTEDKNHNGKVDAGETDPNVAADDIPSSTDDNDKDGLTNAQEIALGTNPNDADSDDDGLLDGDEVKPGEDTDGDGLINALDPDSDNDGLFDGTELGKNCNNADTDKTKNRCIADADPTTTTDPLKRDTDEGTVSDGSEDVNRNGKKDPGETDPTAGHGSDDVTAANKDTDGDGLSDALEAQLGSNPNDKDSDDDGLLDGDEPNPGTDVDGDGKPNILDPDSDNDGLFDGTEMGKDCSSPDTDPTKNQCIADADNTTKTSPLIADTDGGTVIDGLEDKNHNGKVDPGETDPTVGHGGDDLIGGGTDTDHDGLPDDLEKALGSDPNDADTDDDGVLDGYEVDLEKDTDGDGLINVLDPDSDNDGLFDGTELGYDCSNAATDKSKNVCIPDADPTTRTNPLVKDTDGGSVSDGSEDANRNGKVDNGETDPTFGHGADDVSAPNKDTDGDGLSDALEAQLGSNPNDKDSDDDGLLDGDEPNPGVDTDGDGKVNILDSDSDNDGLFDGTEMGKDCSSPDTDPTKNQCIADADNTTKTSPLKADTDGGTVKDGDEDANHNGKVDAGERDPNVKADDIPSTVGDADGDGLSDADEAAAGTNPNDPDSDDDGLLDGQEKSPGLDTDGDGLVNALDPDSDNDGILDGTEAGKDCSNPGTDLSKKNCVADADPTTTTNPLDPDTDKGGVRDGSEDVNRNGKQDQGETDPTDGHGSDDKSPQNADTDGDGLSDALEKAIGSNPNDKDSDDDGLLDGDEPNPTLDNDGDGKIDILDPDSDNDGLFDGLEAGKDCKNAATDPTKNSCDPDEDPATHTSPLLADTDHGGVKDGEEDANHNGKVDPGERDPNNKADDHNAVTPPVTTNPDDGNSLQGGGFNCAVRAAGSSSTPNDLGILAVALAVTLVARRRRRDAA